MFPRSAITSVACWVASGAVLLLTLMVTGNEPAWVGTPSILLLSGSIVSPGGRPLALKVKVSGVPLAVTTKLYSLPTLPPGGIGLVIAGACRPAMARVKL